MCIWSRPNFKIFRYTRIKRAGCASQHENEEIKHEHFCVYKLSIMKKKFALSEDVLRKEIEKQNLHRGIFMSTDYKAYYETVTVNGFSCLIVMEKKI